MPLPDGYLPKEGDQLLIAVTVKYDADTGDDDVHVMPNGQRYKDLIIPLVFVHSLLFRKWNSGERVQFTTRDESVVRGVVISTYEQEVWIRLDVQPGFPSNMTTKLANEIEPERKDTNSNV